VKTLVTGAACIGVAVLAFGVVGCGKSESTSTSMSSSPSAAASSSKSETSASASAAPTSAATDGQDYGKLLIAASDITAPGDTFTAQEPTLNPNGKPGVAALFANGADTREIGDTILVLPDAAGASTALQGAAAALGGAVADGTPNPAEVGTDGTMVSGTSPDGAKAVTVLLFTEGTAFTTLEFDSAPGDPVPPEFVLDVGQKQDAAIKSGLGG
jgi:hypothetical protein